MSFTNCKIKISVNNETYEIYYSYKEETTFQDLLEYFSFLLPSLKICQCYCFHIFENKNKNIQAILISRISKIREFSNYLKDLTLIKNKVNCKHNQQNLLLYSKNKIIDWYENKIKKLESKIKQNEEYINKIIPIPKANCDDNNFTNFYDVIINIESIKDINKGWDIKMSQNGEQNYEKYKKEDILKIGVIGNANKGKSFLLSRISKINLPSGTSLRTEGLSIKYPDLKEYKNRRIVILETAVLETPVLISDLLIPEEQKTTLFREKSREKLITELFLQNYIVNNCDLLIVVVDSLSYSEQKLLIKVKREIERSKKNITLFVVHNLKTYTSKSQVEEYIDNTLKKSATFTLKEKIIVNTNKETKTGIIFSEVKRDDKEINIDHLIYANENSEAGRCYNQYTLDFIENSYQNFNNLKTFDAIESIKKRFVSISDEILERTEKNEKLSEESFDNSDPKKIKLKNEKEIILKKCLIDELGFSNLKPNGFEPKYNVYEKDKKIIVNVEISGEYNLDEDVLNNNGYSVIKLVGMKQKDTIPERLNENLYNSREYGQFFLEIPLRHYLSDNKPQIKEEGKSKKVKFNFLI